MKSASRVKIFDKTMFSEKISKEKWDRVKLVCSQPFNKVCDWFYIKSSLKLLSNFNYTDEFVEAKCARLWSASLVQCI